MSRAMVRERSWRKCVATLIGSLRRSKFMKRIALSRRLIMAFAWKGLKFGVSGVQLAECSATAPRA